MADDYDAQMQLWDGGRSSPTARIALRTSSNSVSPAPSPLRAYSPADDSGRAELCDSGNHIVRCDDYARDTELQPPAPRLVGVEPLTTLLTTVVGRTLANPALVPCDRPVMAVGCPPGSGARSAVHMWAAHNAQRVAVLTYSFFNHERELVPAFHLRLMALAASLAPCILVVHRCLQRAHDPRCIDALMHSMWSAWLQTREHQRRMPGTPPPFWLLFIDSAPINVVVPTQWSWIPHVTTLPGFAPARIADYLECQLERELTERLASADVAAGYVAFYRPLVAMFAAAHVADFTAVADVLTFVTLLFDLPLRALDLDALRAMAVDGAPTTVMPGAQHFEDAVVEMRQLRAADAEREQANRRAADQARRTGIGPGHPTR
jgi:hypothetical protein